MLAQHARGRNEKPRGEPGREHPHGVPRGRRVPRSQKISVFILVKLYRLAIGSFGTWRETKEGRSVFCPSSLFYMAHEPSPGHGMLTMLVDGMSSSMSAVDAENVQGSSPRPSLAPAQSTPHQSAPVENEGSLIGATDSIHQYQSMKFTPVPMSTPTNLPSPTVGHPSTSSPFVTHQTSAIHEHNTPNDATNNDLNGFEMMEPEDDEETDERAILKPSLVPRQEAGPGRSRRRSNRLKRTKSGSYKCISITSAFW